MIKHKPAKILVCMSGGVDSSVAAALLLRQGYDVTGMLAVNYDVDECDANILMHANDTNGVGGECWRADYRDAVRVAAKLGIKLIRLDFRKEYKTKVLDYMFKEYRAGRTPNPDVMCNKFIKFGVWLDAAKELGFDKLATGHYARLKTHVLSPKTYGLRLMTSEDRDKDQTYFLHQLSQKQLQHVLFPIGEYTKLQVRALARKFELPTAEKEESMGICFVGEVPMEKFLKTKIKSKPGKIVLPDGSVIGKHEGLPFYTLGQRHLMLKGQKVKRTENQRPFYVVEKKMKTNELVIDYEDSLLLRKTEVNIADVNWISGQVPNFPLKCKVRLRHRQPLQDAECRQKNSGLIVKFQQPQRAVTPGQFAVLYKSGECLGGGTII